MNGQSLKILFSSPLTNAGFETGDTTGWTTSQQNYGTSLNGQSIPYVYSGGSGIGTVTLGTDSGGMSYNISVQTTEKSSGTYALRLYRSGAITFSNPPGLFGQQPDGYGSLHGLYILSSEFTAENGDQLYVDWSAINGGDWYEVFGYLIGAGVDGTFDTGDDIRTKLFSQRGDTQDWTTTNATISSSGTYKFKFICGTYDASGGKAVGASLYVDNIRVVSATAVNDAVVTKMARLVTFENASDDPPTSGRTLTVEARAEDGSTGSATATITITPVNDDPTDIALSTTEIDVTAGVNGVVAAISTTDADDTSFTYTLVTGTGDTDNGLFNINGTADRLQSRVTSLVTYDTDYYLTFESPVGTTLTNIVAADNPSPDDMPPGSDFTFGLFDFTISGIGAGRATELKLYLPAGAKPVSYYKYGQTPDNLTNHWYEFMFNNLTGAQIEDNVITLYFVDAEKGDDILTTDSMVIDLGGPLFVSSGSEGTSD